MRRTNKITGFTLVELMIATAFIGSLLLVIALVVMQVTTLYTSGLTIKEVNAVSRTVVRDMQQSIANSDAFALAYAAKTQQLLGITTVFGNVAVGQAVKNARLFCEMMGIAIWLIYLTR